MAIQAFAVLGRTFEFFGVTAKALGDSRTIGASSQVFMSRCPVAVHTFQPLSVVNPVVECDYFLFDCVVEIEHILMTIQASLRGERVVGQVLGRHELVTCVLENIPAFGGKLERPGMTLITVCLVCRMPVGFPPELRKIGMTLSADPFASG